MESVLTLQKRSFLLKKKINKRLLKRIAKSKIKEIIENDLKGETNDFECSDVS